MPNRSFTILDIETTGKRSPLNKIIEIAYRRYGEGAAAGSIFSPYERIAYADPWVKYGLGRDQSLLKLWRKPPPGATIKPMAEAIPEFLEAARGSDIWVQNLGFERSFLSPILERGGLTYKGKPWSFADYARGTLQSYGAKFGTLEPKPGLYVTPSGVQRAKTQAFRTKSLQSWRGVFGAIRAELAAVPEKGMTRIFDIADVTRSVMAMAQLRGYMKRTGNVFLGTNVEVFSRLTKGIPEAHRAMADVELEREMLKFYGGAGKKLFGRQPLSPSEAKYFAQLDALLPRMRGYNALKVASEFILAKKVGMRGLAIGSTITHDPTEILRYQRSLTLASGGIEKFMVQKGAKDIFATTMPELLESPYFRNIPKGVLEHIQRMEGMATGVPLNKAESEITRFLKIQQGEIYKDIPMLEAPSKYRRFLNRLPVKNVVIGAGIGVAAIAGLHILNSINKYGKEPVRLNPTILGGLPSAQAGAISGGLPHQYFEPMEPEGIPSQGFLGPTNEFYRRDLREWQGTPYSGLNPYYRGRAETINLADWRVNVDDADTLVLKRGLRKIGIRLAGIDAPEIVHEGESWRVNPDQPYGQQAKEHLIKTLARQQDLSLIINPDDRSYGRYLGVLYGDNSLNINREMLRLGAASYLPYGKSNEELIDRRSFALAERRARLTHSGMWAYRAWQADFAANKASGSRLTHNALTEANRIRENQSVARRFQMSMDLDTSKGELTEAEEAMARSMGAGGRYWQGYADPNREPNQLEALRDQGNAGWLRRLLTSFGSGWRGLSPVSIAETIEARIRGVAPALPKPVGKLQVYEASSRLAPNMSTKSTIKHRQGNCGLVEIKMHNQAVMHHRDG